MLLNSNWALLKGIGKLLGNLKGSSKPLQSLWSILKEYWKATGKYRNTQRQSIGEEAGLHSSYWQKRGNSHSFSPKHWFSVYIYYKSTELWKIFKTLSNSNPIFALWQPYQFYPDLKQSLKVLIVLLCIVVGLHDNACIHKRNFKMW
jgi:hypothetical protein